MIRLANGDMIDELTLEAQLDKMFEDATEGRCELCKRSTLIVSLPSAVMRRHVSLCRRDLRRMVTG